MAGPFENLHVDSRSVHGRRPGGALLEAVRKMTQMLAKVQSSLSESILWKPARHYA